MRESQSRDRPIAEWLNSWPPLTTNRRLVSGSSQWGRVQARPDPAGPGGRQRGAWSVEREAWGGRTGAMETLADVGGQPRFPRARKWVAPSALSADLWAGWGKNALKSARNGDFLRNRLRSSLVND